MLLSMTSSPAYRRALLIAACLWSCAHCIADDSAPGAPGDPGASTATTRSVDDLSRDDKKAFRSLVDQCAKEYNAERFDSAQRLCSQARDLAPHPITLFTLARIHDRSDRCSDAVKLYRQVVDVPPPGASERKWLDEEGAAVQKHLDHLGSCAPRVRATCDALLAPSSLILIDSQVVGRCDQPIDVVAGAHAVTLLSPNRAPVTLSSSVAAGAPTPLTFPSPPAQPPPQHPHALPTACVDLPDAALLVDDKPVGVCPMTLDLPPGRHRVDAISLDGARAAAVIHTDALPPSLTLSPMRAVTLSCADPAVTLSLSVPSLDQHVEGTCADLTAAGPLLLPRGDYTLSVSRLYHDPAEQPVQVTATSAASLAVAALKPSPVAFTIDCPTGLTSATLHVAGQTGSCPMSASLPAGTYAAEVRAPDHAPATFSVTIAHPSPPPFAPAQPEPLPFWTPGVFTTLTGAAVLTAAIIYDASTVSTLNEFKDLATNGRGADDFARYNDLKDTVETNITVTQVLYGVGIATALTGGGLMLYEYFSRPPGDFSKSPPTATGASSTSLSVMPLLSAQPSGASAGVSLHWRF
jgi:hypothetical protein